MKKAEPAPAMPVPAAEAPSLTTRARTARIEAVREVINHPHFNLDGALARAVTRLIEREIG